MTGRTNCGTAGLKIHVVWGATRPAGAWENTLWIETTTPALKYVISYTEPETPEEGLVWIEIKPDTDIVMKATDRIDFNVAFVKQYISEEWVVKSGAVYANGEWAPLQNWPYFSGTYDTRLTGEWEKGNGGTLKDADDYFQISGAATVYHTGEKFSLKGIDSVILDYEVVTAGATAYVFLSVSDNTGSTANAYTNVPADYRVRYTSAQDRQKYTFDVSELDETENPAGHYINVGLNGNALIRVFSVELR